MTQHTPGPWKVEFGTLEHGKIKSEKYTIATVDCRYGAIGEPEANASLIAAAPELLEALENLLVVVNVRIDDPRIKQFDAARAAIAKAKGSQS